jgi:hypothetical protein
MVLSEDILVPFAAPPAALTRVTRCRSTLLVSSTLTLREAGLFDRYTALLAPAWREAVLQCVAGTWLPIQAAIAHYEACDALKLPPSEQARLGSLVGMRVHGTMLGAVQRLASGVGATPCAALTQLPRFWERFFEGGGTRVVRLGPKDARVEIVGLPLARIPHFVNAQRGLLQANAELFATRAFVSVLPRPMTSSGVAYRLAWV